VGGNAALRLAARHEQRAGVVRHEIEDLVEAGLVHRIQITWAQRSDSLR